MDGEKLDGVIATLDELVRPDGAHFELEGWDAGAATMRLRLVLDDAECAECVVPREILEGIALHRARQVVPEVGAVTVDDPRET